MRRTVRVLFSAGLLAAALAQPAFAQFRVFRTSTEVGGRFRNELLRNVATTRTSEYEGFLTLDLAGYFSNPDLLWFDLRLRPVVGGSGIAETRPTDPGNNRRMDFLLRVDLLRSNVLYLSANASRQDYFWRDPYGNEASGMLGFWYAQLGFRSPLLPMTLEVRQSNKDFERRFAIGTVSPVTEKITEFRFFAKNSKTDVRLERVNRLDRLRDTDNGFVRALLTHRLGWGKGSQLRSSVSYYNFRQNRQALRTEQSSNAVWSEGLSLRHLRWLGSSYAFRLHTTSSATNRSDGTYGRMGLSVSPLRGVSMNFYGDSRSQSALLSESSEKRVGGSASASARLPAGARLRINAAYNYEVAEVKATEEAWVPVVNEQHRVPESRIFLLEEALIDASRVTILSEDGAIEYTAGFDYRLTAVGLLTQVEALPAGRLRVGDRVVVNYRYRRLPDSGSEGSQRSIGASLVFKRFSGSISATRNNFQPTGVNLPIVSRRNYDQVRAGLTYSGETPLGQLSAFGNWEQYLSQVDDDFTQYLLGISLTYDLPASFTGGLGGSWRMMESLGRPRRTVEAQTSLQWDPFPGFKLIGGVAYYDYSELNREFSAFDQGSFGGFVETDYAMGLWRLQATFNVGGYHYSVAPNRTERRLSMRLVRQL